MYNKNAKLRGPNERISVTKKRIAEFARCKEDIIYFAENYFHIVDIDKGKHKIKLREYQKRILKAFVSPTKNKRHIAMLASRQIGKTTVSIIFLTHYMLFNEDKYLAICANKEKTAHEILRRIKLAILELPLWLQQGVSEENGGWNKGAIGFENGIKCIAASTASSAIRGEAIALLYLDEFGFVPDNIADDFMRSVYPTVTSSMKSKIVVVSTPNGLNHFYHIWRGATEPNPQKQNNFMPIKINWNEVNGRTAKWREEIIRDIGPQAFAQEYGCQFLGSSNTLIDPAILERIPIQDPIDIRLGHCFNIYEEPQKNAMYILGVDSAKGTQKDYSVVQVLKINSEHDIKQVAMFRNNQIEPYEFAEVVISISEYYNGCYMMIENNETGGTVADTIWYQYEYDKILNCDKKGIGIRSTKTSKLAGNILLKRYIDAGWLEIVDRNTLYELSRYEEVRMNIFQAPQGQNDDCVMSLLWGLYFLNTVFFDKKGMDVKKIDDKYKLNIEEKNEEEPIVFIDNDNVNDVDLEEGWGYSEGLDGIEDVNVF